MSRRPSTERKTLLTLAVVVLAITGYGAAAGYSRAAAPLSTTPASSVIRPSANSGAAQSTAAYPATASGTPTCDLGALGTVPKASGAGVTYPAAQPAPQGTSPTTVSAAEAKARAEASRFGGTAAPASAPVALSEMSYAAFLTLSGWGANPSINPQRCVWVVSVHAAIAEKPAPGAPRRTHSVYTVVLDAASGALIGLIEGKALIA